MKKIHTIFIFALALIAFQFFSWTTAENGPVRQRQSIDFDWKFKLGDVKGAEKVSFDDTQWRILNLPHDWSIEGTYSKDNPSGKAGAFLPTGIGWYRKTLNIEDLGKNDRYFIDFDGVYMNSEVWINGHHLGKRPYGYISFSYNLSPYLHEGKNTISVRVDNAKSPSGRWYTGSGIYRHVWLRHTQDIYAAQWGNSIVTSTVNIDKQQASIDYSSKLINSSGKRKKLRIESEVLDTDGNSLAKKVQNLNISDSLVVNESFDLKNVKFWSPSQPSMYRMVSKVFTNDELIDQYSTPFGIRSLELRGSDGFFLNGKSIKFKGLSNHHDAGAVGAAVPDDILYKRLKMIKDMGCNALRTTHNPFSPTFYNMCDTLGIMVMNEAFDGWWKPKAEFDYGLYFKQWWKRDLEDFIKRDRNHPSVVIWSIGNEIHGFTADQQKEIIDFAKSIDNTRPFTQGRGYSAPYIDIAGFNGHGEYKGALEKYHSENKDKPIIGTEMTHTLQTRGVYRTKTWYRTKDNPAPWEKPSQFAAMEPRVYKIPNLSENELFPDNEKKYQSSYDNSIVRIGVRDDWKRVEKYDYYIGNFRWTGFDYLGESFGWPARTANFGIIDLAGFPKDHYYLYQSMWTEKPMVHLLPHWTHPGLEGIEIPVVVYTNCESAELFLNGVSLGEKEISDEKQLVWDVPYSKGTLTVIGKNGSKKVCEKSRITAEVPHSINMVADKTSILSNDTDVVHLEVNIEDAVGNIVPFANNLVDFEIKGPARLLGVENGDILDLDSNKVNHRKAFKGKCLLLIQATKNKGIIEVTAKSNELQSAVVSIEVK